jgi:hypothetical protein
MRLNRISARSWLLALYIVTIIVVAIGKAYGHRGPDNNFLIFRWSFLNLASGHDMYAAQPQHHTDLYKYSPSFAVLFAPFALIPFAISLALWDALNALLLFFAVDRLLPSRQAAITLALIYLEVLRSMQRSQSNALVTALVILAFLAFERRKQFGAAFSIAVGAAVKIFPLAALALAIFYPRRIRFALMMVLAMAIVLALPLFVVSPAELAAQYRSWRAVEAVDALSVGSGGGGGLYGGVMQQLRLIFGVSWPNWPVQLAGTVLLMLPTALSLRASRLHGDLQSPVRVAVIRDRGDRDRDLVRHDAAHMVAHDGDGADDPGGLDLLHGHHAEELAAGLLRALPAQDDPLHARVAHDDLGARHVPSARERRSSRARCRRARAARECWLT